MKRQQQRQWQSERTAVMGIVIFMLVCAGILFGLLYYALKQSTPTTLRWWAGIATLLCPLGFVFGLGLGTYGARREIAGIETGLGTVVKAAGNIVDLRGQAAASIRKGASPPAPPPPTQPQRQLDLSVLDDGPEFEIDEFDISTSGQGTIQA